MILVGVCYGNDKLMDFRIDETLPLQEIFPLIRTLLLEEISEEITEAEKEEINGAVGFSCGRRIPDMRRSAEENGIRYGDILFWAAGNTGPLS
ncbi:MAG: hypothetical protein Q4B22_11635 [Eubacteriales bacterium]|nr:hypothetical protein [Eubacteriales bacterium]